MSDQVQNDNRDYYYDAFISYRHVEPDKSVALRLHRMLEGYRIPTAISRRTGRKKIGRIFRDREELPTSSNLGADIRTALETSRHLIAVCSPRTPQSEWCRKEIEEFRALHGDDSILSILIEGEPDQSFPDALRFREEAVRQPDGSVETVRHEVEPLAADIRGRNLREMYKKMRTERLRLLAPMIGVRFDDLKQRHRERFLKKFMGIALIVALFLAGFGCVSLIQSNIISEQSREIERKNIELEEQINETEKQRDQALANESRVLADESMRLSDESNIAEAILVALEALPEDMASPDRPYVKEAEWALLKAVFGIDSYKQWAILDEHNGYVDQIQFSQDGQLFLTVSSDKIIRVWNVRSGRKITEFRKHAQGYGNVSFAEFSGDGQSVLTASCWDNEVYLWDARTGEIKADLSAGMEYQYSSELMYAGFSPDSTRIAVFIPDGVHLFDAETGESAGLIAPDGSNPAESSDARADMGLVAYNQSGDKMALVCRDLNTPYGFIVDTATGDRLVTFDPGMNLSSMYDWDLLLYSPDDRYILASTFSGAALIDAQTGMQVLDFDLAEDTVDVSVNAGFSYDGKYMAISMNQECQIFELNTLKELAKIDSAGVVAFHPQSSDILLIGEAVYSIAAVEKIADLEACGSTLLDMCFSLDGVYVAGGCLDNTARIWNFQTANGPERVSEIDDPIKSFYNNTFYPLKREVTLVARYSCDDTLYANPLRRLAVSADGRYAALSYPDGALELYDLDSTNENEVQSFSVIKSLKRSVVALEFHPLRNELMAASEDGKIIIYDLEEQTVISNIETDDSCILRYVIYSPDGKWLAAADFMGQYYLWNAENYDPLLRTNTDTQKEIADIGFTGDSLYAYALYDDGTADRWKLYEDSESLIEDAIELVSE